MASCRTFLGLGGALLAGLAHAQGTPLYSTGFEAMANGPLDGQEGWAAIGSTLGAVVQSAVVFAGAKALRVDSATVVADSWYSRLVQLAPTMKTPHTVTVSWRMRLSSSGSPGQFWGAELTTDGGFTRFAALGVDASNRVGVLVSDGGAFVPSGQTVSRDAWNLLSLEIDFGTRKCRAFLNGALVQTAAMNPAATGRSAYDAAILCGDPLATGTDSAFFDDLAVSAFAAIKHGGAGGGLSTNLPGPFRAALGQP